MRFLLHPPRPLTATLTPQLSALQAYGQQCSPNCGCLLRFEIHLTYPPHCTSPTITNASYHAKRVLLRNGQLLVTQHASYPARPLLLSSCSCETLHKLAQRVVNHLLYRTVDAVRNEMEVGAVEMRSSLAFRHTVLREYHNCGHGGHCYDLVEEAFLAMMLERMPRPRKRMDEKMYYSSTMGGYFGVVVQEKIAGREEERKHEFLGPDESLSIQQSPSSYFLFGQDAMYSNNLFSRLLYWKLWKDAKDSIVDFLWGARSSERDEGENQRPTSTYLQLLDMYGDSEEVEQSEIEDWVQFVDQEHAQNDRSTTG